MSITAAADRLNQIMEAQGISVIEMTNRLRQENILLSDSTIYMVKSGQTKYPGKSVSWRLGRALGVHMGNFYTALDPKRHSDALALQTAVRIIEYQVRAGETDKEMASRLNIPVPDYQALTDGKVRNRRILKALLERLDINPLEVGFGVPVPEPGDFVDEADPVPEPGDFVTNADPVPAPAPPEEKNDEVLVPLLPEPVAEPVAETPAVPVPRWVEVAQWLLASLRALQDWKKPGSSEHPEGRVLDLLIDALGSFMLSPGRTARKAELLMTALELVIDPTASLDGHGDLLARSFVALRGRVNAPSVFEVKLHQALTLALELREADGEEEEDLDDDDPARD